MGSSIRIWFPLMLLALTSLVQAEWPHTRGPGLDGRIAAPGTFEGEQVGLDLAWRIELGSGYSGIAVADGRAVTMFAEGDGDWIAAFDVATGKTIWRLRLDAIYKGFDGADDGPLSSPVIADGWVYSLSPRGHLVSLALDDGTLRWSKRIDTELGGRKPEYGFTTTPLVTGSILVVQVGGEEGRSIVGLDTSDGKKVWSHGDGEVSYESPSLMKLAGRSQIVAINGEGVHGFDAGSGRFLWRHPFGEDDRASTALATFVGEDRLLVPISGKAAVLRVSRDEEEYRVEELYRTDALGNSYAPPVYHDGHIYGYRGKILSCVRATDGERVWRSREPGGDGLILVDRHLVVFGGMGNVVVAAAAPDAYHEIARLQALEGSSMTWPSFASGRIYLRNLAEMAAVAVTRKSAPALRTETTGDLKFSKWLRRAEAADDPTELIEELFRKNDSTPLLEGEFVTFVYRGPGDDVAISGTMIENGTTQALTRLGTTDLFYRTYRLEPGARWEYRFQVDYDDWATDARNPRTTPAMDGDGEVSELVMPGYEARATIGESPKRKGRLETFTLKSEVLDKEKEIRIWLPPGYDESELTYPALLVNDGDAWVDKARMIETLDHVVGDSVAPVVVAFVQPMQPWWQEAGDATLDGYLRMQVQELLPALVERYRLSKKPGVHGTMGNRYYGAAAILGALRHPTVFGHAGVQSAYISGTHRGQIEHLVEGDQAAALRFYIDWNRYDERNVDRNWDLGRDTRRLASLLRNAGYSVSGGEALDSQGWGGWRTRTDELLAAMFPAR